MQKSNILSSLLLCLLRLLIPLYCKEYGCLPQRAEFISPRSGHAWSQENIFYGASFCQYKQFNLKI